MRFVAVLFLLLAAPVLAQPPPPGGGDLVDDTSPQLGAGLDVNEFGICDGDGDTCMDLEASADEDIIRFTSLGAEVSTAGNDGTNTTTSVFDDDDQNTYNFNLVDPAGEVSLTFSTSTGEDARIISGAGDDLFLGANNNVNSGFRISAGSTSRLFWNQFNTGLLQHESGLDQSALDFAPADGGGYFYRAKDTDTFPYFGAANIWGVKAGGDDNLEVTDTYVEVKGCRHYGQLASAPTPNGACDTYYDTTQNHGHVYDGSTWRNITAPIEESWGFSSRAGAFGTYYFAGDYSFSATTNDFNPLINFGTANSSKAAHLIFVCADGDDGGTDTVVRITGTSITDAQVRTAADTQDIVMLDEGAVGAMYESSKKWLGQVSLEKQSGPDLLCGYGWAKYWDYGNRDYTVSGLEATWLGGANDSAPDILLRHHKSAGWTYNVGAAPTPPTAIASMNTDHSTESEVFLNEQGAWKVVDLAVDIDGDGAEGIIFEVVAGSNNAFETGNLRLSIIP